MTRDEFFTKLNTSRQIYMFNERVKKAWETILPQDGIKAFFQSKHEMVKENGTYIEEYYVLTNDHLLIIFINVNQLISKSYLFKPYYIEKNFRFINDFGYEAQIDEIKVYMEKDDTSPIIIPKVDEKRYDYRQYLDFIGNLN